MATITAFKDVLDIQEYRPLGSAPSLSIAGSSLAWDERNTEMRHPEIFEITSAAIFNKYSIKNDSWYPLATPALTGTFTIGATGIMAPSQGPQGTLTTGNTTTSVVLSTTLPAAVGANQLANRGDGRGFVIRIKGNSAGGSGKTEEAIITSNTAGTTPTITLNAPLSFTPATGDGYEILSGRVYLLSSGIMAAGCWKYYDIATNSYSGNLAITNLPATISTGSDMVALDEGYVINTSIPGQGYVYGTSTSNNGAFFCLLATGSAPTTITGQATAGDAAVAANQYRNFQIRIVQDTATPTSVGQRRNITSHTAGPSAVYTVPTWTVTPSTTAQFVIEQNTDKILLWTTASANTYTYSVSGNTWDTTTYGVRGGIVGAGVMAWLAWGITPDLQSQTNPGMIYSFRGGALNTMDVLDITGGTNGAWTNGITYGNQSQTFSSGSSAAYIGSTQQGRYAYLQSGVTQNLLRFDCTNRVLEPYSQLRYVEGAAVEGKHLATTTYVDATVSTQKLGFIFKKRQTGAEWFENVITR